MSPRHEDAARRAVEHAARSSYGRLVAYLAVRWRDLAAAEDALSEAFASALAAWPRDGVPRVPDAWLLTAARHHLLHRARHQRVAADPAVARLLEDAARELAEDPAAGFRFPDERLKLLFVCAHPAIDTAARTPLMLQAALGLDAARIASAFLVAPATMSQRLVRAKARIRDTGMRYEVPELAELPERLDAVLEAIYAAYGSATNAGDGSDPRDRGLAEEAVWLARIVVGLLPQEPEARGLLALMLHCEARRAARRDDAGRYVPLAQQDVDRWSRSMLAEAERELAAAAQAGRLGHFQLEAAIQSAHAARAAGQATPWPAIIQLYEGLLAIAPTLGARVAHAAALAEDHRAAEALAALDAIDHGDARACADYQPYWAVRAHVLAQQGRTPEALDCYARASGLSEDPAVRAFLMQRAAALARPQPRP